MTPEKRTANLQTSLQQATEALAEAWQLLDVALDCGLPDEIEDWVVEWLRDHLLWGPETLREAEEWLIRYGFRESED